MRSLLSALAVLIVFSMVGCGQGTPNMDLNTNHRTPTLAGASIAQAPTVEPTLWPTPTLVLPTRRAPDPTKTPLSAPPAPTRSDGIPIPVDATGTKNVPNDIRTYIQGQLKGIARVGQPLAYLSPHPPEEVIAEYQLDLDNEGWESIPISVDLADGAKLLVAQKDQLRAVIAFVGMGDGKTVTYIVATKR